MSLDNDYKGKGKRRASLCLVLREPGTHAHPSQPAKDRASPGERDSGRKRKT